ncbi:MAG TPA: permease prefix domain 1-containing protein [Pyrinomonadaceae bacterium]|nr:permease prefix domain 1-containing protein [Pyrinomonadaceae bacterium]
MKDILRRFDPQQAEREIDEELRLHIDLLTEQHLKRNLAFEDARAVALDHFGDVELIKNHCARIKQRSNPLNRALKLFLTLVFIAGAFIRISAPEYHLTRVGGILMAVGVLGRLWLYVRGLTPSTLLSKSEISSPLRLIDKSPTSITAYDQKWRTPVERVIFDK